MAAVCERETQQGWRETDENSETNQATPVLLSNLSEQGIHGWAWEAGEQAAGDWRGGGSWTLERGRDQGAAPARQQIKPQVQRNRWGAAPNQRAAGRAVPAAHQQLPRQAQLPGLLQNAGAQAWASAQQRLPRRRAAQRATPRVAGWVRATACSIGTHGDWRSKCGHQQRAKADGSRECQRSAGAGGVAEGGRRRSATMHLRAVRTRARAAAVLSRSKRTSRARGRRCRRRAPTLLGETGS